MDEEERFLAGTKRAKQKARFRRQRARVRSTDEPVVVLLEDIMTKVGVSEERMERVLGLPKGKVRDVRRGEVAWRVMGVVRRMFEAMGYELQVRAVRRAPPLRGLIVTNEDVILKEIRPEVREWSPLEMIEMWKDDEL